MYNYFDDLMNGRYGKVNNKSIWDEEKECFVVNGTEYEMVENGIQVDIDTFLSIIGLESVVKSLMLFIDDGVITEGIIVFNNKKYYLDITMAYMVYQIEKKK